VKCMVALGLLGFALHAQAQQASFEWNQIKDLFSDRYLSPTNQNVNTWVKQATQAYAQKCPDGCSKAESLPLLRQLLTELNDPHVFFSWPVSLEGGAARPLGSPLQDNTFDFEASVSASGLVVTLVLPKGVSDRVGLRPGDVIERINNQAMSPERLLSALSLAEAARDPVEISLRRGQKIRLDIRSRTNFTPPVLSLEDQSSPVLYLPDLTGLDIADRAVHDAVHNINKQGKTQLIIDLRQNIGGGPWVTANAAGAFVKKTAWQLRDKKNQFWVHSFERGKIFDIDPDTQGKAEEDQFENPAFFSGKVCVLVDQSTFSNGENFALLLQKYGGAWVVGTATHGGAGAGNNRFALFLGPNLSLTTHLMYFEDGTRVPTQVTPDQVIPLDVEGVVQGRDNQLEACQTWLKGR
jgi:C-terminal processing protease CtpA/Prc